MTKVISYVECLLGAGEIFQRGILVQLHHFQRANYYKEVLSGRADGVVLECIANALQEMDVEAVQLALPPHVGEDGVDDPEEGQVDSGHDEMASSETQFVSSSDSAQATPQGDGSGSPELPEPDVSGPVSGSVADLRFRLCQQCVSVIQTP